jgi:AcrR family transcriptional regulator
VAEQRASVLERLLDTATRLFYAEGIRAVGIDRILAESGVAKSSMYVHFRTKEDLVVAYLRAHSRWFREHLTGYLAERGLTDAEAVLAVFDFMGFGFSDPEFRGCAFVNAAVEYPAHPGIRTAVADHRAWLADLFTELLPADQPGRDAAAAALLQLSTGASMSSYIDHDRSAADKAHHTAALLLGRGDLARRDGPGDKVR